MKLALLIQNYNWTDEENKYFIQNQIIMDWDLPFLPNKDDWFQFNAFIDDLPDIVDDYCETWIVTQRQFCIIDNEKVVQLFINNE